MRRQRSKRLGEKLVGWFEPVPEPVEELCETQPLLPVDFMFRLNPKSAAEMINRQMASLLK